MKYAEELWEATTDISSLTLRQGALILPFNFPNVFRVHSAPESQFR
jgi:hypothetical protein